MTNKYIMQQMISITKVVVITSDLVEDNSTTEGVDVVVDVANTRAREEIRSAVVADVGVISSGPAQKDSVKPVETRVTTSTMSCVPTIITD